MKDTCDEKNKWTTTFANVIDLKGQIDGQKRENLFARLAPKSNMKKVTNHSMSYVRILKWRTHQSDRSEEVQYENCDCVNSTTTTYLLKGKFVIQDWFRYKANLTTKVGAQFVFEKQVITISYLSILFIENIQEKDTQLGRIAKKSQHKEGWTKKKKTFLDHTTI